MTQRQRTSHTSKKELFARMELIRRLVEACRVFQELNRFVAKSYSTHLSLLEGHIMVEVDVGLYTSGAQLAAALNTTPLAISRAAKSLVTQRLLRLRSSPTDRRLKVFELTRRGHDVLVQFDLDANARMEQMCGGMSYLEIECLRGQLCRIADGFGAAPTRLRARDHILRGEARRLSRALGLLESGVFGVTDISSIEWHCLAAVRESSSAIRPKDLCGRFDIAKNTASLMIDRLAARSLLARARAIGSDRREQRLDILPEGVALLERITSAATAKLLDAARSLSDSELTEVTETFERLTRRESGSERTIVIPRISVARVASKRDREDLRIFLDKHSSAKRAFASRFEDMFDGETAAFLVRAEQTLVGVVARDPNQPRSLITIFDDASIDADARKRAKATVAAQLRASSTSAIKK